MEVNMTKIMLVEDDKSLREIYGVRLLAEGYEIISAGDGEEALAMAVKEKPGLILSDVMMPKISGFDMLDILRSTPETKDVKVIMMTALSSEDQRTRGETLGANLYLVKSQVGIEDVVRAVHDVLGDVPVTAAPATQKFGVPAPQSAAISDQPVSATPRPVAQPPTQPNLTPEPPTTPPVPTTAVPPVPTVPQQKAPEAALDQIPTATVPTVEPQPAQAPEVNPVPVHPTLPTSDTSPTPVQNVAEQPVETPVQPPSNIVQPVDNPSVPPPPTSPTSTPVASTQLPQPTAPFSTAAPASLGDRVINPITPSSPAQDMTTLINQEIHDGSETSPQNPEATV